MNHRYGSRMKRDGLSGKYKYHSTKNNSDAFVSTQTSTALDGKQYYLIHRNGTWYITNEKHIDETSHIFSAFLCFHTKGLPYKLTFDNKIYVAYDMLHIRWNQNNWN